MQSCPPSGFWSDSCLVWCLFQLSPVVGCWTILQLCIIHNILSHVSCVGSSFSSLPCKYASRRKQRMSSGGGYGGWPDTVIELETSDLWCCDLQLVFEPAWNIHHEGQQVCADRGQLGVHNQFYADFIQIIKTIPTIKTQQGLDHSLVCGL